MYVTLLATIWGSNFVLVEAALHQFQPLHIVAARLGIAVLAFLPMMCWLHQSFSLDKRLWPLTFAVGMAGQLVPWLLYAWGQQGVTGSLAGIYTGATPLLVIPIAYLMVGNKPSHNDIVGAAIGFVGVCLVVGLSVQSAAGTIWHHMACLAGAASYAASFSLMAMLLKRTNSSKTTLALWQTISSAGIAVPIGALVQPIPHISLWQAIPVLCLLLLGLGSAFANGLNFVLVQSAGPLWASLSFYLIPVVAVILGVMIDGDRLSALQWLGFGIVITGMVVVFRGEVSKYDSATKD